MSDVFISYAREDSELAKQLADILFDSKISVWWDVDIRSGENFSQLIMDQIEAAKAVIVIWSERSARSDFVRDEANRARLQNKFIPLHVEGFSVELSAPPPFGAFHSVPLNDTEGIFAALARHDIAPRTDELDLEVTIRAVFSEAKHGRFTSYAHLAKVNGAAWQKVRYKMWGHLWDIAMAAHERGWPMLTSVIVSRDCLETGEMKAQTLEGFLGAARELGYDVSDENAVGFLKEQQREVFERAKLMW